MDIEERLRELELRLTNIEAALRDHNIWPAHMTADPAYLAKLKRDFTERGVEAIHEYNRCKQEEEYQRARLYGKPAEAYVYKNRLHRNGYLYNGLFYFRWGTGLRALSAGEADVELIGGTD